MQAITEYCGIPVNWKVPRIKPGNVIRFWYWDSQLNQFQSKKGLVIKVRYLSSEPLQQHSKNVNDIVRGNVMYTIKFTNSRWGKTYINSFYNQRMSNVEIVK